MNDLETKQAIVKSLAAFTNKPLADAATALFESLGYKSQKRITLKPNTAETFVATFAKDKSLNPDHALLADWQSVDFLFQLTDDEVRAATQSNQPFLFESKGKYNGAVIESYLFFAVTLKKPRYTRTQLSTITRAVNRLFPMPAMLLFRNGETLTIAVINRRLHKRDESKDVLEKVTLIKDIRFASPHRAHIEILHDLSFDALHNKHAFSNFVALHRTWQETLDIQALNKRFFIEVRNWFYWARLQARFPDGAKKDADKRDSEALIRLLTRMIFVWFLREKRLIADELFAERTIETLARDWRVDDCEKDKQGRYYKAILQNLFFATLNTPIEERKFRSARSYQGKNKHYGDQRYFRHVALFHEKAPVEELYKTIPFLNGGLFEMLDEIPGRGDDSITEEKRVDGFSDVADKQPLVPDFLFFGDERRVPELSALLGESTAPKARGLLKIFRDYKFTIEENTPLEQDIALDPELLGRAFENLLAAVNPETGTVARKSTGSFYTPREIVNYMVEEAIRLRPDSTKMTPDFLVFALSSRIVRTQIEELGKTTAGNIGISGGDAKSFVVPVPPLPEQRRIVFELDALQAEVDALKRLQAETAPGLDALAPRHPSAFAWLLRDRRPRLHPPSSHFGGTRRRIVNPKELLEKLPLVRGWIDRTLSAFMRSGVIHDAGRGWYSRIAEGKSESAVL